MKYFLRLQNKNNTSRRRLYMLFLLLGSGVWIWFTAPTPENTPSLTAPQADFLAPSFTLSSSTGNIISLSDYLGRPVIINIWASWCGPCRAEMPALENVYMAYKDLGLEILAVNATNQDSQSAALDFAQNNRLTFPILFDTDGTVSKAYHLQALPSTFFVRPDGIINEVVIGGPMSEALLRIRAADLIEKGENWE